jgi:hypothetical protein
MLTKTKDFLCVLAALRETPFGFVFLFRLDRVRELHYLHRHRDFRQQPVLDQTLEHLELVLVEPGDPTVSAPINLDQMGRAVESP